MEPAPTNASVFTWGVFDGSRCTYVDPGRLRRAKAAYTTRFVSNWIADDADGYSLLSGDGVVPRSGDVVLARVEAIGQHSRIDLPAGRRARLFVGDEILVAYGNRYAPDQFEAEVPNDLGVTSLVAAGGVAGEVLSSHSGMLGATTVRPVGLLVDAAGIVTLQRCAPYRIGSSWPAAGVGEDPVTIGVLGTSMNSGKTTAAAALVRGLTASGLHVVAGKVTGTGAPGDPGLFVDLGAARVLDFTDFGYSSTYCLSHDEVRGLLAAIRAELSSTGPDVIVLEIADGLYQRETLRLVTDPAFGQCIDTVFFAAGESMGAVAGVAILGRLGIPVAAVGGLLTASALAIKEVQGALDVPVLDVGRLSDPDIASWLLPPRAQPASLNQVSDDRIAV